MNLADLSNEDLLTHVTGLFGSERQLVARLIACLAEIEERRLHLEAACSSLFDFCVRRVGLSEGEAFRRITAARLVKRFPDILGRIERGEIHLSALVLLRDHLTESNCEELLAEASRKSKREVQELLARRFPKPDVPSSIQNLPSPPASTSPQTTLSSETPAACVSPAPTTHFEPLSEARYKVQLTASAALRDKLERATRLMSHRNPSGDLAVVVDRALDLLIAALEKERLGTTTRPQKARPAKPGHITRAVRRQVFARDGEQCSYVDELGRRCPARSFLELDHVHARALGGTGEVGNIRVLCRAHNGLLAERTFGRAHVERHIHVRQRKSPVQVLRCGGEVPASVKPRCGGEVPASVKPHCGGEVPASVKPHCGSEVPATPKPRCGDAVPATFDHVLATRALTSMGFRESDARRALGLVQSRVGHLSAAALPIERVLREALAFLS